MENPGTGVIGRESNGDKVAFRVANIYGITVDGVQKVELTNISTPYDGEWVLGGVCQKESPVRNDI